MKRRTFLRHLSHSLAIPGLTSSLGLGNANAAQLQHLLRMASDEGKVLVLIFLEGGNDGLNTVIPLDQLSALNKVRSQVILPEDSLIKIPGKDLAFHPSLPNFRSLYTEGRLGIVQSVGYPDQNFSHFRSTDIWMSGSDSKELVNSGWAGRYLAQEHPGFPEQFPNEDQPDPLGVEIGNGGSLLFQGPSASMSVVLNDTNAFYRLLSNEEEEAPPTNAGDKLRFIRLVARQSQQYSERVVAAANKVSSQMPYEEDRLSQQLKIVARLIAGGLQTPLYLVRLGGFDTHDNQVMDGDHTKGEHADLLKSLNDGVSSFMQDLEFLGVDDRVVGMTFSEFGRRIISNASRGTDHGAAAPLFVFGNSVKGGVLGNNPIISDQADYSDNIDAQFDFRQIYASMLGQWYLQDQSNISNVLSRDFNQVEIIGESSVVTETQAPPTIHELSVYPNPISDNTHIKFFSDGSPVLIRLYSIDGKRHTNVYKGSTQQGQNSIQWNTSNISQGQYILQVINERSKQSIKILK